MSQIYNLNICIVRLSALGDVLMLLPLVRTLQANLPVNSKITWIISRPAYDFVDGIDGVEFIVIDKPNSLLDLWKFWQSIKHLKFDILLATQASLRANILYPFIKAKRKIGYDKLRAKDLHGLFINETIIPGDDHTVDSFLKFAECIGFANYKIIEWRLYIPDEAYLWVKACVGFERHSYIVINPAASKPERSWPVVRYIALIEYIQNILHIPVVLTGGPTVLDSTLAIAITKVVSCCNVVGKTNPKQLLALISDAKLVICPDTGPSHMACAVGTPVIALHAVTSAQVSGPYLYKDLAIDCYAEAIELLKIQNAQWGQHAHGNNIMELITVDSVLMRLHYFL